MPDNREYLKRLEALNGGPLRYGDRPRPVTPPAKPAPKAPEPVVYSRLRPRTEKAPVADPEPMPEPMPGAFQRLETLLPGEEVPMLERGVAYRISTPLSSLAGERGPVGALFAERLAQAESGLRTRLAQRCGEGAYTPEQVMFVDLETTGLGHTPLFLIGALLYRRGEWIVQQYLARHYGEEAAAVALFMHLARDTRLLISFNGKSFDWPYLRMRAMVHAVPCLLDFVHFDLLHESRRVWKGCFQNCKLQTLEQCVCGHPPRVGDIPGAAIPAAYHLYVHTGNAVQIAQIVRHNLLDLMTLAELAAALPEE